MARTPKIVEDRREQIMDAAMRVFAQEGFDRATNKDIAREAGITPGLIYHYFESKEALLRAILEEWSPLRLVQLVPPDFMDMPPEIFLRVVAQQLLNIVEDERYGQLARLFLSEAIRNPAAISFSFSSMQEGITLLERYLVDKMETGVLQRVDPSLTIQVFGGSLMALVLRRQIFRDPIALQYSHEQLIESVVTLTLQGLLPR